MKTSTFILAAALALSSTTAFAVTPELTAAEAEVAAAAEIQEYCDDAANKDDDDCAAFVLDGDVLNFAFIGPAVAALVALVAAGSGSTTSTTSTTN